MTKGRVQQGRYSPTKDAKSNRKPNKKTHADKREDEQEIKDAIALNVYDESGVLVRIPVSNNNVAPAVPDNRTNHDKVADNRPEPGPSWHLKIQAMQPGRSYLKKKDDDSRD